MNHLKIVQISDHTVLTETVRNELHIYKEKSASEPRGSSSSSSSRVVALLLLLLLLYYYFKFLPTSY